MSFSIASASACSISLRSRGVLSAQAGNAAAAARTASSTSAASLDGTEPMTSPVAGLMTSSVAPLWAACHELPMKLASGIAGYLRVRAIQL